MQELNQFNQNQVPDFRFARNFWLLVPICKWDGDWPFFLSCGRPCTFNGT